MVNVLIAFKNDFEIIESVVKNLLDTAKSDDIEILIYNDGSVHGDNTPRPLIMDLPYVKVINSNKSFGVGYSFDRLSQFANGEHLVLMGADVFPKDGWYYQVKDAVQSYPNTLGCAVCVGLNSERMSIDDPKCYKRYGVELLFYVDENDLPKDSGLRQRKGGYTSLFKGKWLPGKQSDDPYEIPCLMGAFYFTSKEYYRRLNGWDTVVNNRYCGHRVWGHLEPYISLKSWLVGGGCTLYPGIEVGHVFGRIDKRHKFDKGSRSAEWMWWNALFILETMILTPSLHNKLYDFVHPELNFNIAKKMIKNNWSTIEHVREQNRSKFKNDYHIFEDKFNYDFNF